jgi:hypothetical protein
MSSQSRKNVPPWRSWNWITSGHPATHVILELSRRVYRGIKDGSPDDEVFKLGQITSHIADLFPEAAAEVERLYPRSKVE